MESFRNRIARRKSHLSEKKKAAALGALTALATHAEALTVTNVADSFSPGMYWSFEPLTGDYAASYDSGYNLILAQSGSSTVFLGYDTENTELVGEAGDDAFVNDGDVIGPSSSYLEETTIMEAPTQANTPYYLGYALTNRGPGNDQTHYGWVEFQFIDSVSPSTMIMERFAVGEAGEQVTVGVVPEPSVAALAMGGIALIGMACKRWLLR